MAGLIAFFLFAAIVFWDLVHAVDAVVIAYTRGTLLGLFAGIFLAFQTWYGFKTKRTL